MANDMNAAAKPPATGAPDIGALKEQHAQQMRDNIEMQKFQMQVNADNTKTTAMSTLIKGSDDVMRAIANQLK